LIWLKNVSPHWQEFGEGARARRLYENNSDEEEEGEAVLLNENPKLSQGF
jgi:hypothetical protein